MTITNSTPQGAAAQGAEPPAAEADEEGMLVVATYTTHSYAESVIGIFTSRALANAALQGASEDVQRNTSLSLVTPNVLDTI